MKYMARVVVRLEEFTMTINSPIREKYEEAVNDCETSKKVWEKELMHYEIVEV